MISSFPIIAMKLILANLWMEAAVVGAVCVVVLILFVIAGLREIANNKK